MGILGFGGVTKLEDLKVKDLKKERLKLKDELFGLLQRYSPA